MLIGGQWRDSEKAGELRDPYRGEIVGRAPRSTLRDLDDALAAAAPLMPAS